jgi:hypothetical protein
MSNQESMYQPPEQSSGGQQIYNNDPYEQPQASYEAYNRASSKYNGPASEQPHPEGSGQERAYQEGYNGASTFNEYAQETGQQAEQQAFPFIRTRNLSAGQIVLLIIGLVILSSIVQGLFSGAFGSIFGLIGIIAIAFAIAKFGFDRATPLHPQQFAVSGQATLHINNPAGPIRIQRGEGDKVVVQAVKHISSVLGKNEDLVLDCQQEGDNISIVSHNIATQGIKSGHMDLNIFVPEQCQVHLDSQAGAIHIQGIQGYARVKTNAGTIHVSQSTLEANSDLHSNAGTIHLEGVKLAGNTNINTNAGTIHFDGELGGAYDYRLHTNAGTVHVALPSTSAFALKAKTNMGTVDNDFGSEIVGNAPLARLNLSTNVGTIKVQRR